MREIVLASNNPTKAAEVSVLLEGKYNVVTLSEKNIDITFANTGTFMSNAKEKVNKVAKFLPNSIIIADEAGLLIDHLNGYPGPNTADVKGETSREKNMYILDKMKNVKDTMDRQIMNLCILAVYNGEETIYTDGKTKGTLAFEPRGENGFGFDEIFVLEDGRTFAELTIEEKARACARNKAYRKAVKMMELYEF